MFESFPVPCTTAQLQRIDFVRFSDRFAEILKKKLPTIDSVEFVFADQPPDFSKQFRQYQVIQKLFTEVAAGRSKVGLHQECLLLPFGGIHGHEVTGIISGADPLFLQRVSSDWLQQQRAEAEMDFLLFKQARIDPVTGLLNLTNLVHLLDRFGGSNGLHLVMIEIPPQSSRVDIVIRHVQKSAALLLNFFPYGVSLHYLGHCVFVLVEQNGGEEGSDLESRVVAYLKREGCKKVRVGSTYSTENDIPRRRDEKVETSQGLLNEAWMALRFAAKRGPYSFCEYGLLASPQKHPLYPPSRTLLGKLNRIWQEERQFCLVQFAPGEVGAKVLALETATQIPGRIIKNGGEVYVFLPEMTAAEGLDWARSFVAPYRSKFDQPVAIGVACYPFGDFSKVETVFNCRKALLHGEFLGNDSAVIFNALSLNVSGDIYFSDGDLAKAQKEYQRGLKIDPADVNLYNSLGVTLALMNRVTPAMESFGKALEYEPTNFMALFNLGLAEIARGNKADAYSYLQRAEQNRATVTDDPELLNDLLLQLGTLSAEIGDYPSTLRYLPQPAKETDMPPHMGQIRYCRGVAFWGLGQRRQAMIELQRALRCNELDSRAMHLLGKIFFEEREGDDIALSLCRKSVELEPENLEYRLSLAKISQACGHAEEAAAQLRQCIRHARFKADAQFVFGCLYRDQQQYRKAAAWFARAAAFADKNSELSELGKRAVAELRNASILASGKN